MKASELVELLQKGIATYGDLNVEVRNLAGDLSDAEGLFFLDLGYKCYAIENDPEIDCKGFTKMEG